MKPVIMYAFWGRRGNVELQLPLIQRILEENPNVQFHAWNLARQPVDYFFIKTITGNRITVHNQFFRTRPHRNGYNMVYQHYTHINYQNALFVKIDDDVIFMQTGKFVDFVNAVEENPNTVISAQVINNGACAKTQPIWHEFTSRGSRLLDWHLHQWTAELAHGCFFDHWRDMLNEPSELVPTDDWLSINFIGYTYEMGKIITARLGTSSPLEISGRTFNARDRVGDEGAVNMSPRAVYTGFTCAHLSFGPQNLTVDQVDQWRQKYGRIGEEYLKEEYAVLLGDQAV
jgi:hypothetical protein